MTFAIILKVIIIFTYIKHLHPLFTFQLATAVAIWISCSLPGNIRIQNPNVSEKISCLKVMYPPTHICSCFGSFSVYERLASICMYCRVTDSRENGLKLHMILLILTVFRDTLYLSFKCHFFILYKREIFPFYTWCPFL